MTDTAENTKPRKTAAAKPAAKPAKAAAEKPARKPKAVKTDETGSPLKAVTAKGRQGASAALHLTRDVSLKLIDSQRAVWLAGLGALARASTVAGSKGEEVFEALVKAGESLEEQAREAIDSNTERLKERIEDATEAVDDSIDRLSNAFDSRVEKTLERIGYPSGDAMKQLFDRLTELAKTMEAKVRNSLGE